MARKRVSSMSELSKEINKLVKEALKNERSVTANVIKEVESDMVEQEVYDKYQSESESSYAYVRRGRDGGLADTENMLHIVSEDDGKVKTTIINMTPGKSGHEGESPLKPGELAQLVEGGDDFRGLTYKYGYGYESYFNPRPFQAETVKFLKSNKDHVKALRLDLMLKGLDVK